MKPLRVLIVDDEAAARRGLRLLLADHEDVAVVGEAGGFAATREALARLAPDVVFLDVRMPGGSGLEAVRGAGPTRPVIVLVTAYEDHALEAFDVEAVDYLLKPFSDADFDRALERVRRQVGRIRAEHLRDQIATALDEMPRPRAATGGGHAPRHITVRYGERLRLIDPDSVLWVQAEGDYVRIHTGEGAHLLRTTMASIARRLGPRFLRVHRSTLVRMGFIREITPRGRGRHSIVLQDGQRRNVSPRGYEHLERVLGL